MTSAPVRFLLAGLSVAVTLDHGIAADAPPASPIAPKGYSLADCLRTAMQTNHRRPASRFAVAMPRLNTARHWRATGPS